MHKHKFAICKLQWKVIAEITENSNMERYLRNYFRKTENDNQLRPGIINPQESKEPSTSNYGIYRITME